MFKKTTRDLRRYYLELGGSMLAYMAALIYVVATRQVDAEGKDVHRFIEVLPIIPLTLAFWAIIRQFRRCDEYYQHIHAEAFALGAMVWGLIIMMWAFAENAGAPPLQIMFIAPGLIAAWGLCLPIIIRRYK